MILLAAHPSQNVTTYTFPDAHWLPWFAVLAFLAIALWWDAWSTCQGCKKKRAYCDCDQKRPGARRPKFNDPLSRKRRGEK